MNREYDDIAIVGISCRFPGAKNYTEYWENLIQNKNSVSEVPKDRWNWEDFYGDPDSENNKTNIKWGGFIDDVDKFDPLFFKISPNEASYIDPQHRLILESSWHAIEDAGYNPRSLAGKKVGVYVGVSKNDYAELMRENKEDIISFVSTGTVHSIVANRVSFLLDFVGKSEVVDTACSSFMVALNNAVRDIRSGTCESAVVGGVNSIITPTMYISHSKSGMLSNTGTCRTFDAGANGYVRGEGVGVIYIKSLKKAREDGDHIWGVVKGISVSHGGKSNFLTAPKVSAQAETIRQAVEDAAIDPTSVSYIEAHGTGTPLGDPIEINALKEVYGKDTDESADKYCGISAVKTNIGHLESAAGVAGLIKVLLSFKHKRIPKLLHYTKTNPYIKLEDSPFFIVDREHEWAPLLKDGAEVPRRAGLSSFGMGGVNAHAILEEAPALEETASREQATGPYLVPVSAKSDEQLKTYVETLNDTLKKDQASIYLPDFVYTLQTGREAMDKRVAFVANDAQHLSALFETYLQGGENESIAVSAGKKGAGKKAAKTQVVSEQDYSGDLTEAATLWVNGCELDWEKFASSESGKKMPLPAYPFKKMRCWFESADKVSSKPMPASATNMASVTAAVPAASGESDGVFRTSDYFVRDHKVKGECVIPGVKYLDAFYRAFTAADKGEIKEIRDAFWLSPIKVTDDVKPVIDFDAATTPGVFSGTLKTSEMTHCTADIVTGKKGHVEQLMDIERLQQRCPQSKARTDLYQTFRENGLDYGPTFQVIHDCRYNENEIVCELKQVEAGVDKTCVLEPSMMDGVYQTVTALYLLNASSKDKQLLPFYLNSLKIYQPISAHCFVYATRSTNQKDSSKEAYKMYICNAAGEVLAEFTDFVKRVYELDSEKTSAQDPVSESPVSDDSVQLSYYSAEWIDRKYGMRGERFSSVLVFDNDTGVAARYQEVMDGSKIIQIKKGKAFKKNSKTTYTVNAEDTASFSELWSALAEDDIAVEGIIYKWNFKDRQTVKATVDLGVKTILRITQTLIMSKNFSKVRFLYMHPDTPSYSTVVHAMIGGFSRTLAYENPHISLTAVGVDTDDQQIVANIAAQELSYYFNAPLYEVRYREGIRQARVMCPKTLQPSGGASRVKEGGTYLITGGAGGLGFLFARHLAETHKARLILAGRSGLSAGIEDKLKELESLGGQATYIQADASDEKALEKALKDLRGQSVELNGLLHCAGLIEDSYIIKKAGDSFDRVISPKVWGTINLDKLTQNDPLDFFLVFSSIASIMPNQGQCDYAAANSFMDEFVNYRSSLVKNNERSGASVAINWPLWKNGGIGVIKEEEEHLWDVFGMKPLGDELGIEIFEDILINSGPGAATQLVAIEGVQSKINQHLRAFELESSESSIENEEGLKEELKRVISLLKGSDELIQDDEVLSDYGIDSIGVATLTSRIEKDFGVAMDPTQFFDCNTPNKIAASLWPKYQTVDKTESSTAKEPDTAENVVNNIVVERGLVDIERTNVAKLHFKKDFSDEEFFMRDHVVEGKYNVPGACFIEMALECGEMLEEGKTAFKLVNNYWAKQLSTSGSVITAELDFVNKGDYFEYEISSRAEGEKPVVNALGQLYICDIAEKPELGDGKFDFEAVRSRCTVRRESEEVYQFIHAEGLHVGPSFQPMIDVVLNEDEALSHLVLQDYLLDTAANYVLHPSLLTGVLQTALLNNKPKGMDETRFIPIAIDEIVVNKKIPEESFIYTQPIDLGKANEEIRKFNAQVITPEGETVAELKGLTLRNLTPNKDQKAASGASVRGTAPKEKISSSDYAEKVEDLLKDCLSSSIGLAPEDIDADVDLESYGINSVMIVELNRRLGDLFGSLSKTLFFEYKSIEELAQYFMENHSSSLSKLIDSDGESEEQESAGENEAVEGGTNTGSDSAVPDIFMARPAGFVSSIGGGDSRQAYADDDDIAIISVSGRYPQANSLSEFWNNLHNGVDSVTTMPKWRFDVEKFYEESKEDSLLTGRWGGFIDDVDKFDPQFFNISPREAVQIDPQERLFLQTAWEAVEGAGYTRDSLKGQSIGVFVGALWQPYIGVGTEQTSMGNMQTPSGLLYSIPNRVSFFFDWSGPSIAIDTACSGSLSALHFACESVKRNECEAALVGGVNLSFGSSKYLWLARNQFLSSEGKCRSFGEGGDGYVPGEGVGAVYIKRLSSAIRDKDTILGVIKGTSVNHGGKTNGYTVPNPNRQAELIGDAIKRSGVSPEKISYVEAHGTGTSLGDPIEITGLTKAFSKYTRKKQFCSIGSVKSNIGHLEAAAGIAGLTKLLLQMKYKKLVPSLHAKEINANIDFSTTPFAVQRGLTDWNLDADSGVDSRCAMLSSFGAGGSNAHLILEEYAEETDVQVQGDSNQTDELIFPLSAKNQTALLESARRLLQHLTTNIEAEVASFGFENSKAYINSLAYTYQTGKEAMSERLVIVAKDLPDLVSRLQSIIEAPDMQPKTKGVYRGDIKSGRGALKLISSDNEITEIFHKWVKEKNTHKIANLWVNGIELDWSLLYKHAFPRRVLTPSYPFKKDRFWLKEIDPAQVTKGTTVNSVAVVESNDHYLHPLLHANTSDFYEQKFSSVFTGKEKFFVANGASNTNVMSESSCKEMIQEAICQATGERASQWNLAGITWQGTVTVSTAPVKTDVILSVLDTSQDNDGASVQSIEIFVTAADKQIAAGIAIRKEAQAAATQTLTAPHAVIPAVASVSATVSLASTDSFVSDSLEKPSGISLQSLTALAAGPVDSTDKQAISVELVSLEAETVSAPFEQTVSTPAIKVAVSPQTTGAAKDTADIRRFLADSLAAALYIDAADIDHNAQFVDMGLDSIVGVEWIQAVNKEFGLNISATKVYDYPTIADFSGYVASCFASSDISSVDTGSAPPATIAVSESPVQESVAVQSSDATLADVQRFLKESLARALYMSEAEIGLDQPFTDMGLDSIVGVEWMQEINHHFGLHVSATKVYDYPTITDFSPYLLSQTTGVSSGDQTPAPTAFVPQVSSSPAEPVMQTDQSVGNTSGAVPVAEIEGYLVSSLATALYLAEGEIETGKLFTEMGLDSIVGVEWVQEINKQYGLAVSATKVYDYPTIADFSRYLNTLLGDVTAVEHAAVLDKKAVDSGIEAEPVTEAEPVIEETAFTQKLEEMILVNNGPFKAISLASATQEQGSPSTAVNSDLSVSSADVQTYLINSLASALYMTESEIETQTAFTDMGLDSIVGVEWIQAVNQHFGLKVNATKVYDYPTIIEFSEYILRELGGSGTAAKEDALALCD